MKTCPQCVKTLDDEARYCSHCGAKLDGQNEQNDSNTAGDASSEPPEGNDSKDITFSVEDVSGESEDTGDEGEASALGQTESPNKPDPDTWTTERNEPEQDDSDAYGSSRRSEREDETFRESGRGSEAKEKREGRTSRPSRGNETNRGSSPDAHAPGTRGGSRALLAAIAACALVLLGGLGALAYTTMEGYWTSSARITFSSTRDVPEPVRIRIDGRRVYEGTLPHMQTLEPSRFDSLRAKDRLTEVEVTREGYETMTRAIDLKPGIRYNFNFRLEKRESERGPLPPEHEPVPESSEASDPTPSSVGSERSDASTRDVDVPKQPSREMVQSTIVRHRGRIRRCAERSNPRDLSGSMFVKFRIAPSGSVTETSIRTSKFEGTDVGGCVEKVVSEMQFPETRKGLSVKYPFMVG